MTNKIQKLMKKKTTILLDALSVTFYYISMRQVTNITVLIFLSLIFLLQIMVDLL